MWVRVPHEWDWLFCYRTCWSPIAVRKSQRVTWQDSFDNKWRVATWKVSIHDTERKYLWNFLYWTIHHSMGIIIARLRYTLEFNWTIIIEFALVFWNIICNGFFSRNLIENWTVFGGCWILESNLHHFLQRIFEFL